MRPCPSSSGLAKAHMATTERHEDRVHPIFSDDRSRSRRSPRHPFHMQAHAVNILTALQPCSQSAVPTRFPPRVQSFPMGVWYCMVMLRTAGEKREHSQKPVTKTCLGPRALCDTAGHFQDAGCCQCLGTRGGSHPLLQRDMPGLSCPGRSKGARAHQPPGDRPSGSTPGEKSQITDIAPNAYGVRHQAKGRESNGSN